MSNQRCRDDRRHVTTKNNPQKGELIMPQTKTYKTLQKYNQFNKHR